MRAESRKFLWSGTLVVLGLALSLYWLRSPDESSSTRGEEGRPLRESTTSPGTRIEKAPTADPGVPVTFSPDGAAMNTPAGISASVLNLRAKAETAALRERHRPHLEALGHPPDTAIEPRTPPAKEALENPPGELHAITVKFIDDYLARVSDEGILTISAPSRDEDLAEVIQKHGLRFSREQTASDDRLARLEARAIAKTGEMAMDLSGILAAAPGDHDRESVRAAAEDLLALDGVEFVSLSSLDVLPPPPALVDIAPPSELLTSYQTYRGNSGILMDWAWTTHQMKGQGVRVTDCEYAYNANHEDLSTMVTPQSGVNSYYTGFGNDHGTAVLGVLTAGENAYGMTGMVPGASTWFYPEFSTVNGQSQSRLAAITAAIADSDSGDVVLLEMQTDGALGDYGPAEYNISVWNAVKTATNAGIIVVAAAGNGSENLDAPEYAVYRNRGDSGSIIVGAGSSTRSKLSFSTYGTRVNVQGWGQNVATLGYADLRAYGADVNQEYTSRFSGTSSASPIVTSAVVALQSFAKNQYGEVLTPLQIRDLLVSTGKSQTGVLTTPIGPLPDMQAAVTKLQELYEDASLGQLTLLGAVLAPGFSPERFDYSSSVLSSVNAVAVVPVSGDPDASVHFSLNGGSYQPVQSGSATPPLALNIGSNAIIIRVTGSSGYIQKFYTIIVNRSGKPIVEGANVTAVTAVSAVLGANVTTQGGFPLSARGIIYCPDTHLEEPLIGGPGVIQVVIPGNLGAFSTPLSGLTPNTGFRFRAFATNSEGTVYTPVLSFRTLSTDARLQSLLLTGKTFSPDFSRTVYSYEVTAGSSFTTAMVQASGVHPGATLRVRMNALPFQSVAAGAISPPFAVNRGSNVLEVEVTAEDGVTSLRYFISIFRPEPPVIQSATIGGISRTSAVFGAEVISEGGSPVIERGIVYSPTLINSNPTLGGHSVQVATSSGTVGPFLINVAGLAEGVRYSFRGFCRTSFETVYTSSQSLVTSKSLTIAPGETTLFPGGYVAGSETIGFQLETDSRMQTVISVMGSDGLTAVLRDTGGDIVATFNGAGPVLFDEILEAGVYSLELSNGDFWGKAFTFSAAALTARPDLTVGSSPALHSGAGIYSPAAGQTLALVSRNLKPVRGYVSIRNSSGTPTALRLRGTAGSSFFAVQYADFRGNQTAGIIGGYYTTGQISREDDGVLVTATFSPSKKRLMKKRGKRTVILRKAATFTFSANVQLASEPADSVTIQLKTQ